ncbi:MAG: 50S ribosome-binding GTPase, partial [Candidatus Hydrogenedentes bacterium]|nr:50S ribosome-binding GTPase [Candidatus Hydrogenedentota bacterium]
RERDVIITDTVGFIRDLPADLVAAFESTLEEVHKADLLVHVIDGADPQAHRKVESVERTLEQMGLDQKPRVCVLNKTDLMDATEISERAAMFDAIPVSARSAKTLTPFLDRIDDMLFQLRRDRQRNHDEHTKSKPGNIML